MKYALQAALLTIVTVFAVQPVAAGQALDLKDKVSLQATMQRHIERNLVDGAYLHLNSSTGEIRELRVDDAHPMILRMGEFFVLCSSFLDAGGEHVNIDFYLAPRGHSYVVFAVEVENRDLLEGLMKTGKVKRAE